MFIINVCIYYQRSHIKAIEHERLCMDTKKPTRKKRKETLNFQTKHRWIVLDGCNTKSKAHLQGTYKLGNLN